MTWSSEAKQQARQALTKFFGRGQGLTQEELNEIANTVNDLLDEWREHGHVVFDHGHPVSYIEIYRDEFEYEKIKFILHYGDL